MKNSVKTYIGIDFSKEKFNACLLNDGEILCEGEFENKRCGFNKLVNWVKRATGLGRSFDPSEALVCGEHTGTYSTALSEYLYAKGYNVWLENAMKIKRASGLTRGKDDRADAVMVARYAMRFYEPGKTFLFQPESQDVKTLRSVYMYRHSVVRERVALGNQIASKAFDDSPLVKRRMASRYKRLREEEKELEQEMTRLMSTSEELSENHSILMSFKGIGTITTAMLIIFTGNFTKFRTAKEFACFCGIAPFGKESGSSIKTRPHVSRFAHIGVKAALVQACKAAIRDNSQIRDYADRLKAKGKEQGVLMNNVKNKVIHIVFKMVETKTLWNPDHLLYRLTEKFLDKNDETQGKTPSTFILY